MRTQRIILGLDPGTNLMGFGIIKKTEKSLIALQYGVINMNKENRILNFYKYLFFK